VIAANISIKETTGSTSGMWARPHCLGRFGNDLFPSGFRLAAAFHLIPVWVRTGGEEGDESLDAQFSGFLEDEVHFVRLGGQGLSEGDSDTVSGIDQPLTILTVTSLSLTRSMMPSPSRPDPFEE